ncbi:MAG: hypothetical protein A2019_09575 [Sulfurimonas sp. GWF2_37_8]|nr:MAG: hypothetical protein A2019_09575 [Sulfurimonas sp. GWF2_37_8]
MKKILFLVTKSINGGAQKWTKEQIEVCSDAFKCYLGTGEDGWLVQNTSVENSFIDARIYKRFCITYLMRFVKYIKINKIDIIVASSANAGIYARLAKLFYRDVKVVYVTHGWSSIYNGGKLKFLYMFIEKQLSKISDSILCVSKNDYDNAKNILKIKENKLKLLPNSIFPMQSTAKSRNLKLKVLTVARLTPPKRVDLLIDALEHLDIELHIVGDGPLREELSLLKHANTIFHGEVDNFHDFSQYDIFALISDSEGLPLSALEAMSCGLPLVLSDVGGCSELIDENGFLVKNNGAAIEKAILNCIENLEFLSKNSKKLFDKKFNLQNNKHLYLEYYKKMIL